MSNLKNIQLKIIEVIKIAKGNNIKISIAESCSGGMLSSFFIDNDGVSSVFDRGLIVYSNQAKIDLLGINVSKLEKFGAVSEEIALEMAAALNKNQENSLAIAITGIAGPNGGSDLKPIGLVYISCSVNYKSFSKTVCKKFNFMGLRNHIRYESCFEASIMAEKILIEALSSVN